MLTIGRPLGYRQKLHDILCSDGSLASLYLLRRRVMSDEQLRSLGHDPHLVSAEAMLQSPVADIVQLGPDSIASVSRLEAMLYQGNMLLRDSDTNGMAHSLEIRVPMLDRRIVEFASQLSGNIRFPRGAPPKQLLRASCADLLRPRLLQQAKMGFTLPIRRWMTGPLRDICVEAIEHLAASGLVNPQGVRHVWEAFAKEPETPMWSRAFTLVVLGHYLKHVASGISCSKADATVTVG
jgi:asparagine synthase (glutamine-hydrolysing)